MNAADILRAARKRIERPECWTQFFPARNELGLQVSPWQSEAARWCAWGAIEAERPADTNAETFLTQAMEAMGTHGIGEFNDTHTHAEVLAAFDKAIAAAEGR